MNSTNVLQLSDVDLAKAQAAYNDAIVIDGSNLPIVNSWLEQEIKEQFFTKMIAGGVTASNITVPSESATGSTIASGVKAFTAHRQWIEEASDKALHVLTAEDIRRAKREKRAGIIFGPQNSDMLEDIVESVGLFYGLGLRVMQLTYNTRNFIGDGCMEPANAGLSRFGHDVIAQMDDYGIVIDLSHCGDRTTAEAIEATDNPVVFTHANVRAVLDHPRNRTDDHVRAMAEKGGVICLTPFSHFVRTRVGEVAPLDALAAHFTHVADLVGVEHIGIGSDINENNETRRIWYRDENPHVVGNAEFHNYPMGFDGDLRNFGVYAELFVKLGLSVDEIGGVLGGNLMRVFEQVWRA